MLKYAHCRMDDWDNIDSTLVIDTPTKAYLTTVFNTHSNKALLTVGIAVKSKHDQFEKKKGRLAAEKRLAPVVFDLVAIDQENTTHVYNFVSDKVKVGKTKCYIHLRLTTVAESEVVKLISANISTNEYEIS